MGVITNVVGVIIGTIVGLLFGRVIPERFRQIAFLAMGVVTLGIGIVMIVGGYNDLKSTRHGSLTLLVPVLSLVIGAIVGEALRIEQRLENLGGWLEHRLARNGAGGADTTKASFVEGFMSASILYCVGAMSFLGSIQAGLGDSSVLYLKSLMDGITSIALAVALGVGVGFSALPLLVLEGGLALLAMRFGSFFTTPIVASIDLVGGIMLLAIGIELIGIKKMKVANMLPALLIAIALGWLMGR